MATARQVDGDGVMQGAHREGEAETTHVDLLRGRFASAWSLVETRLRTLELMHVGRHTFRPVADVTAIDLKVPRRFEQRVKLVVPKGGCRKWLVETHRLRNLLLHGVLIRVDGEPAIIHADFQATLEAGLRASPNRLATKAVVPIYANSVDPETTFRILEGGPRLVSESENVRSVLGRVIEAAHAHGSSTLSTAEDGINLVISW